MFSNICRSRHWNCRLCPKIRQTGKQTWKPTDNAIDKYTAIANEYLDSKPSRDLINSTDLSIIKKYSQYRSDKGIEFVVENFDAYVEATSLEEVSKFLLGIITDEAFIKAMQGDSNYVDLVDSMDEDPLKRAAAFERDRDPESRLLPENQRDYLEETFSSATSSESLDTTGIGGQDCEFMLSSSFNRNLLATVRRDVIALIYLRLWPNCKLDGWKDSWGAYNRLSSCQNQERSGQSMIACRTAFSKSYIAPG